MSLSECIVGLVAEGRIRKGDAEKAERAYTRHFNRLKGSMSMMAAAAEASELALRELEYDRALRMRQALLQDGAQQRIASDISATTAGGPYKALRTMLNQVEIATQRIEFQAQARIIGFIERHRRNLLGQPKDKTGMRDVVVERHGGSTGNDSAKAFSDAIAEVNEWLRQRFNRGGGAIGHRADFGLPHHHDSLRVRRAGYEQWRADILAELAPEKMVDPLSGQGFTPERLEEFLKASFANIRSGGMTGEGSGGSAARMLANRRSDPRYFVFKDGEAWLRYNEKYGGGNPFDAILGHIRSMSRDIALMERFGPNPAASWKFALRKADGIDAQGDSPISGAVAGTSAGRYLVDKQWRFMNGDFSVPVFPDGKITGWIGRFGVNALASTRDLITAAFLGSAQITAISDINTQAFARKMNALPQVRMIEGYLQQLNPLSHKARRRAVRLGLGARDATRAMLGISRFIGETHGPRWSQVIADDVLRLSGLNKWTEAGQRLFGDHYLRELAEERHLAFADLPEERRTKFEQYGISEADWDAMRRSPVYEEDGVDYMAWDLIEDPAVSDRMMDMVLRETRAAVQEADAQAVSAMKFGRPGTVSGELGSNVTQFKSFPVALLMNQAQITAEIGRRRGIAAAGAYAAQFAIGMTLLGALALQLKEISKARDPRPMDNWEFWGDAFLQGGGLGIFGDFVGSFFNDRANSIYSLAAGPMAGLGEDVKAWAQSFGTDEDGKDGNPGRQTVRLAKRYTPGTSLWYARAAFERLMFDQLAVMIDPDYDQSWQRMEERAEDQGQGYWWRPGETAPDRAPEMGEAE